MTYKSRAASLVGDARTLLVLLTVLLVTAHQMAFRGGSFLFQSDCPKEAKNETTRSSILLNDGAPLRKTQRVYLLPRKYDGAEGELRQIYQDGIDGSELLEQTDDMDELGAVWVVDELRMSCDEITPLATQSMERRRQQHNQQSNDEELVFKIFLLDIADWRNTRWFRCVESLSKVVGKQNVHFAIRQHVWGRSVVVNETDPDSKLFTEFGEAANYDEARMKGYNMVKVLRYAVRSDLSDSIDSLLISMSQNTTTTKSEETNLNSKTALNTTTADANMPDRVLIQRPGDVVHFFPPKWSKDDMSSLRCAVSRAIQALSKEANLTVFTDFSSFGAGGESGRSEIHDSYATGLLHYKIVVVAQRDFHEGHFRLMEALIGGALVLTDPMHPFPYMVEDGKNLVVYNSLEDMKSKIRYYLDNEQERLAIARRGYEIASKYHRTWHLMERLIFSDWSF